MSLFPEPPGPMEPDRPAAPLVEREIRQERRVSREAGAVRWRAMALAEYVFGGPVAPTILEDRPMLGFHAAVELHVPFRDLDSHLQGEARFAALAAQDEILSRYPALFLFRPRLGPVGGSEAAGVTGDHRGPETEDEADATRGAVER